MINSLTRSITPRRWICIDFKLLIFVSLDQHGKGSISSGWHQYRGGGGGGGGTLHQSISHG